MNRFQTTALAFLVGGFTTGMCACAALKDLPDTAFLGTCAVIAAMTWVMMLAAELADAKSPTKEGRMNRPSAYLADPISALHFDECND